MPDPPGVHDEAAAVHERPRPEAALTPLPVRQRAAGVLWYYQHLPEEQVARLLGCLVGTAPSLTSRRVEGLRRLMPESVDPLEPTAPAESVVFDRDTGPGWEPPYAQIARSAPCGARPTGRSR